MLSKSSLNPSTSHFVLGFILFWLVGRLPASSDELISPYWETGPGFSTKVEVTNNAESPRSFTLSASIRGVDDVVLASQTIASLSTVTLDLESLLQGEFRGRLMWGSAVLYGADLTGVIAWIVSGDTGRSAQKVSTFIWSHQTAKGLITQWQRPDPDTSLKILLSNPGPQPSRPTATICNQDGSCQEQTLLVGPGSTKLLHYSASHLRSLGDSGYVRISASSQGLLGRGVTSSRSSLRSSSVELQPLNLYGTRLQSTPVPFGVPGEEYGFPVRGYYSNSLLISNVSESRREVAIVSYRDDGSRREHSLLTLGGFETRLIKDLPARGRGGFRSIEIVDSHSTGSIIGQVVTSMRGSTAEYSCPLTSVELAGTHKFAVTFDLKPGRTTVLSAKNVDDEETTFSIALHFATESGSGVWIFHPFKANPQGLITVNLKDLRDQRTLGYDGSPLPLDLVHGSAVIGSSNSRMLAADPTFDFSRNTVALCNQHCGEGDTVGGDHEMIITPCELLFGPPPPDSVTNITDIGEVFYELVNNQEVAPNVFNCTYKPCETGKCRRTFLELGTSFCPPGIVNYWFELKHWYIFRYCERIIHRHIGFRPCL